MTHCVNIGSQPVGDGCSVFVIAEIGINHNGDVDLARKLIDAAVEAGCDAVKFQKRTPGLCVPADQRHHMRCTPWGDMTYIEYRHHIEFGEDEFAVIDDHCRQHGTMWFASCWDQQSVEFIEPFNPPAHKIASASLTNIPLLDELNATGRPMILSTGMSTMDEIDRAIARLDSRRLLIAHSTSAYPCPNEQLNLRMIHTLVSRYNVPVGYSGHETGLQATLAAVALGATFVERHITLDRAMWGSDQAASIEPDGLRRLVRDIRVIEAALGDGVKRVYDSERSAMTRLRPPTALSITG